MYFRMSKSQLDNLLSMLIVELTFPINHMYPVSAGESFAVTLRYLAYLHRLSLGEIHSKSNNSKSMRSRMGKAQSKNCEVSSGKIERYC